MQTRRASIKETGEELSQSEWDRFDAAVAQVKAERSEMERRQEQPVTVDRKALPLRRPSAKKTAVP